MRIILPQPERHYPNKSEDGPHSIQTDLPLLTLFMIIFVHVTVASVDIRRRAFQFVNPLLCLTLKCFLK